MNGSKRLLILLLCLLLGAAGAVAVNSLDAGNDTAATAAATLPDITTVLPATQALAALTETVPEVTEPRTVPDIPDITTVAEISATQPESAGTTTAAPAQETAAPPSRDTILGYTAVTITPGVINEDSLTDKDDRKVYAFTLDTSAGVRTLVTHSAKEGAGYLWFFYLYEVYKSGGDTGETSYRFLSKQSVAQSEESSLSALTGLYPGSYIIVATCGTVFSDEYFDLTLKADTEGYYEQEPNDNIFAYNEIMTDRPVTGVSSNIGLLDEDWFMFTLTETTVVNIRFAHDVKKIETVAWLLELTDGKGNSYYFDRSLVVDEENLSGDICLPAGNYFYSVKANISNYTEYTVTVNTRDAAGYETEYNDAPQTANRLEFSRWSVSVRGSVSDRLGATDKDWFYFDIPASGIVSVSLQHDDYERSRDAWRVLLYNESNEAVWSQNSALNETTVVSPYIGLDAGRYYLRVDADNLLINNGTYTLNIQYSALDGWESERNNSLSAADEITVGEQISGCIVTTGIDFDEDLYCFTVEESAGYIVSFSHTAIDGAEQGWLIDVLDADGEKLTGFDSLYHDGNRRSDVLLLEPGRYYVRISSGLHFSPRRYTVEIIKTQG